MTQATYAAGALVTAAVGGAAYIRSIKFKALFARLTGKVSAQAKVLHADVRIADAKQKADALVVTAAVKKAEVQAIKVRAAEGHAAMDDVHSVLDDVEKVL